MRINHAVFGALVAALTAGAACAGERAGLARPEPAQAYAADTAAQPHDLSGVPVAERGDVISWKLVTNGPVPDTPANRARYEPLSHGGRATQPAGN